MKKVIVAGLLGGLVLMAWTFVVNGLLRFQSSIDMNTLPAERQVYEVLKEHVVEPGRYVCNPELTSEGRFPDDEPVFSILYGGMGHGSAGKLMLVGLVMFFLAPMTGAWLLSRCSDRTLSSYPRKVSFFAAIGLIIALFSDLTNFGIGDYPVRDAVILAAHDVVVWFLMGLVVAAWIKPVKTVILSNDQAERS